MTGYYEALIQKTEDIKLRALYANELKKAKRKKKLVKQKKFLGENANALANLKENTPDSEEERPNKDMGKKKVLKKKVSKKRNNTESDDC